MRQPEHPTTSETPTDPAWAWTPFRPQPQRPWDLRLAGHLARRAGFGCDWQWLHSAVRDGPQRTIDRLLHPDADVAAFDRTYDQYESAVDPDADSTVPIRQWWLRRMMHTPHPLQEKMTLFWHDYFATSVARGAHALSMHRHLQVLRQHALGQFSEMLAAMARDPALLVALDASANRKARPNQTFARAFLEVLTVGPGNFADEDVHGVARAFTGWFVLRNQLRYVEREHDEGSKRILGQQGPWKSDDAVRIALAHPGTSRNVVRRLYRWFISETQQPSDALIEPLAHSFAQNYDIAQLVGTMLRSNLFFSKAAYRCRVKSPVEYAIGLVRGMQSLVNPEPLGYELAQLGQDLCHPPTLRGWVGGTAWISEATLIRRSNLAADLFSASGPYGNKLDPEKVAHAHGHHAPHAAANFLIDLYLQGDVAPEVRNELLRPLARPQSSRNEQGQALRQLAYTLATLPEFQLA